MKNCKCDDNTFNYFLVTALLEDGKEVKGYINTCCKNEACSYIYREYKKALHCILDIQEVPYG